MKKYLLRGIEEFAKKAASSRKFWLCIAAMTSGSALFGGGLLTADQWMKFTTGIVALYVCGNVSANFVKSKYFVPEMHTKKKRK